MPWLHISASFVNRLSKVPELISATEFKAKCIKVLGELEPQGRVITKSDQPITKLVPLRMMENSKLVGLMEGKVFVKGNIFTLARKWRRDLEPALTGANGRRAGRPGKMPT
jgi:hypothetical protein